VDEQTSLRMKALSATFAGLLVAFLLCAGVHHLFLRDPLGETYLREGETALRISGASKDVLEEMIEADAVTWDPTAGTRLKDVLAHLKRTPDTSLLMVGSSQLLMVTDDLLGVRIQDRVDRVLPRVAGDPLTAYNLSKRGMTQPEKQIVVKAATDAMRFDYVLIAVSLWDCREDTVSPWLAGLRDMPAVQPAPRMATWRWASPASINKRIGQWGRAALERRVGFIEKRTAIQMWLLDLVKYALGDERAVARREESAPAALAEAVPNQMRFDSPDERQLALRLTTELLDSLVVIRDNTACEIVILLPPIRQDEERPCFLPTDFVDEYGATVRERCRKEGFRLLDATTLLDPVHFPTMAWGKRQRIDAVHFDAAGHRKLAEFIARELGL